MSVAAAGNEQDDGATDVAFPATIEGVLAVGAIDKAGRVAGFSNHGDDQANQCTGGSIFQSGRCHPHMKPELVAPGVGILSAWSGDAYVRADGTSQATPFVTSVVALMLEAGGPLDSRSDVNVLKRALMDTAKPVDGQALPHDDEAGYGIVQADAAIAENARLRHENENLARRLGEAESVVRNASAEAAPAPELSTIPETAPVEAPPAKSAPGKPKPKAKPASTAKPKGKAASKSGANEASSDDLSVIKGLGPKAATALNAEGVTSVSQIAAWTDEDIDRWDDKINGRGRIRRDDWVGQAKALAG